MLYSSFCFEINTALIGYQLTRGKEGSFDVVLVMGFQLMEGEGRKSSDLPIVHLFTFAVEPFF